MALQTAMKGVYPVSLGFVNVFLIESGGGLVLVDTGVAGSAPKILAAIAALGRRPEDVHHILLTHLHVDHAGSLAEMKRVTGAKVAMHPADAALTRQGIAARPAQPGPGFANRLVFRLTFARQMKAASQGKVRISPVEVELELCDDQELDFAPGLQVIALPGHTQGHVGFIYKFDGNVTILGDAAAHMLRLGYSFIYENLDQARQSLVSLSRFKFETALFSHGKPIYRQADQAIQALTGG